MSPHSFEMFVFLLCRLISFLARVPPIRSRVTPAAVRISILSAIVPVIRTTDTVIAAVVATLIPLITSTRNHHEASHGNSVHDYSEIVHQTLPFAGKVRQTDNHTARHTSDWLHVSPNRRWNPSLAVTYDSS